MEFARILYQKFGFIAATRARLSDRQRQAVRLETLIGMAINTALSLGFAFLRVKGAIRIPLWGPKGMALDFVPQIFMIVLATTIAITLSLRSKLRRGAVQGLWPTQGGLIEHAPQNLLLRALTVAVSITLVAVPISVLALLTAGIQSLAPVPFLVMKAVYGAGLTALIGPHIARAALLLDPSEAGN